MDDRSKLGTRRRRACRRRNEGARGRARRERRRGDRAPRRFLRADEGDHAPRPPPGSLGEHPVRGEPVLRRGRPPRGRLREGTRPRRAEPAHRRPLPPGEPGQAARGKAHPARVQERAHGVDGARRARSPRVRALGDALRDDRLERRDAGAGRPARPGRRHGARRGRAAREVAQNAMPVWITTSNVTSGGRWCTNVGNAASTNNDPAPTENNPRLISGITPTLEGWPTWEATLRPAAKGPKL